MIDAIAAAFGLGIVSGLRTFTGHLALIIVSISGFPAAGAPQFLNWSSIRILVAVLAVGEYIGDKLPSASDRTALPGLAGRMIFGGACGFYAASSLAGFWWLGPFCGAAGSLAGAFAGIRARKWLTKHYPRRAFWIAIAEDALALIAGIGIWTALAMSN